MTAETQRQSTITLVGEEVQEIFIPTPCRMPGPVHEEQRDGVGFADAPLVDHLEHRVSSSCPRNPKPLRRPMNPYSITRVSLDATFGSLRHCASREQRQQPLLRRNPTNCRGQPIDLTRDDAGLIRGARPLIPARATSSADFHMKLGSTAAKTLPHAEAGA